MRANEHARIYVQCAFWCGFHLFLGCNHIKISPFSFFIFGVTLSFFFQSLLPMRFGIIFSPFSLSRSLFPVCSHSRCEFYLRMKFQTVRLFVYRIQCKYRIQIAWIPVTFSNDWIWWYESRWLVFSMQKLAFQLVHYYLTILKCVSVYVRVVVRSLFVFGRTKCEWMRENI